MHSTHSDGALSPRELVRMACGLGLDAIALTDHDTISGVAEAQSAGAEMGVRVLPGVEISVEYGSKTVHMLGYRISSGAAKLSKGLADIQRGRMERNHKMIARLNELGVPITYDDVEREAGGDVIGRPHFAKALVRLGAVAEFEAFDKYLARGAPAYVDRLKFSPEDSIAMIREAGGVAVLAHPKYIIFPPDETLEMLVLRLKDCGMQGIECHYSDHTPEETEEYLALSRRHGLIVTGGSDFHDSVKPDIFMGTGRGNLRIPTSCADAVERGASRAG
ncbi:MAG: PHP domain-containing protein [bacterium]|nr:PHP domain-containing protein [Candidatus Sumerlaeota bacterium]